jgi:hypothetical protein
LGPEGLVLEVRGNGDVRLGRLLEMQCPMEKLKAVVDFCFWMGHLLAIMDRMG